MFLVSTRNASLAREQSYTYLLTKASDETPFLFFGTDEEGIHWTVMATRLRLIRRDVETQSAGVTLPNAQLTTIGGGNLVIDQLWRCITLHESYAPRSRYDLIACTFAHIFAGYIVRIIGD